MRTYLPLLAALMMSAAAHADDTYGYLAFQSADGTEQTVAVDQLRITFADGQLLAVNASTNQSFTLTGLSKMYFTQTASTGITEVTTADGDSAVQVYNLSGVAVGTFDSLTAARAVLNKGVYIVKTASRTYKIAVR